ncbi:uncharacterized protein [Anabrus simplex]|uniref:uncharacterized protein n=1 Tax=Anabrus simplex TaxID=316456 RepID=UPI0035A2ECBB
MTSSRLGLTLLLASAVVRGVFVPNLHQACMRCLCVAASGCNLNRGCDDGYCGPFTLSRLYWLDAGQPVLPEDNPAREQSFENCAQDYDCAKRVVRAYMSKFKQDCNEDGSVNCDDFAMIHYNGGYKCGTNLTNEFGRKYFNCRPTFVEVMQPIEDVDDACLECLCLDRTGCNINRGCERGLCGPFAIPSMYWVEGGRKVITRDDPANEGAFERCAQDQFCAAETVRGYYRKYGKVAVNGPEMCRDLAEKYIYGPFYSGGVQDNRIENILRCYSQGRG